MTVSAAEKYKAEYAEVGNLRRHYSTVRSALTTFSLTVSFAAFSNHISQPSKPLFLVFVGIFMLLAALLACLVFSYRSEKADLYTREVWLWFGAETGEPPPQFRDYRPKRPEIIRRMRRDEMNWVMLVAVVLTVAAFHYLR